jgi:hypothetical protein
MNLIGYQNFLANNNRLVSAYKNFCTRNVVRQCEELPKITLNLFHGTSQTNADAIIQDGFKLDRFSGTKPMGVGVYLTEDLFLAKYFGNTMLDIKVKLERAIDFTFEALRGFKKLDEKFFSRIKTVLNADKSTFLGKSEVIEQEIAKRIADPDIVNLAEINHQKPREVAVQSLLYKAASIVKSNLFTECLQESGYSSLHTYNDIYGGIMGRPMNQWVVTDTNEILKVQRVK